MHTPNVVAAWTITAHDRLQEGMQTVGVDARDLAALTLVSTHDGCSLEWLRARIGLTQSGTVRLVDRLSDRGLLQRGASTGRGVPLHLTGQGQQLLQQWQQARDGVVEHLLAGVPAEQRSVLVRAMAAALLTEQRDRPQADATCRTCSWAECGQDCPVDRSVPGTDGAPVR
jgi:DNA-binding MarR family transcriptional regulator